MACPILEHVSIVWSPCTNNNMHKLKMVQCICKAATFNKYPPQASVTEILNNLDLPTLEELRKKMKLIVMYKIIHRGKSTETK